MKQLVKKVDVWLTTMENKPGMLARKLAGLADAGANLEFIFARRTRDTPPQGLVFVAPIRGRRQIKAAKELGFTLSNKLHTLRLEGKDRPGLAAQVAGTIGAADINLRGFSAAVIGPRYVVYLGFDTAADMQKAQRILTTASP
jgi:hypothetical protein